jgi:hypothetical protein
VSQLLKRPPAREVHFAPQQGPLVGRQTYAAVDSAKSYGAPEAGRQGGTVDFRPGVRMIQYVWQYFSQVNPAHAQPKLIFNSAAQPFTVGMQIRRYSRTFMAASPRFQGRWAYVGQIQRAYTERGRMTGNPTRLGTTYSYPRYVVGPRTINLAGGGPPAGR